MIRILKLVTGDDVIADVEKKENELILKNPQAILATPEGIGLMPLMPFSNEKEYAINLKNIIFDLEPEEELKNSYNSKFGSGIVIAKNSIILED